jgi:hypothetical protein
MTIWQKAVIVSIGLSGAYWVGFAAKGMQQQAAAIEQHPFVQVQEKCSRCGEVWDRPRMACYLLDGKPEIRFCPKCVYQQADSFIRFCPAEE